MIICCLATGEAGKAQEVVDTLFYEAFNSSQMPSGWTQERLEYFGTDLRWQIRQGVGVSGGIPNTAKVGSHNLTFHKEGDFSYVTRLITPPIVVEAGNTFRPELRFWHAQRALLLPPNQYRNDFLRVLYRHGKEGEWEELMYYESPNSQWEARSLLLPQGLDTTYIAFEGITNWGGGVVVDEVQVVETEVMEMFLDDVTTQRPTTARIAAGTQNNPVSRTRLLVLGNTGEYQLEKFTVQSENTSDADIKSQGVKLYLTNDIIFNTHNPVGQPADFVDGVAVFDNLDMVLPRGYSYLWVAYDVREDAGNLNIANASIPEGGIQGSCGALFPEEDQNPMGHRIIYRTVFYDDFDQEPDWLLTGEFQIAEPQGRGGTAEEGGYGNPGPSLAFIGNKVLGTDITGLGDFLGNYEPNLAEKEWVAESPVFDCTYFTDVNLSFQRWLNVFYAGYEDKVSIDVSVDGGESWEEVWRNDIFSTSAMSWSEQNVLLPQADRQSQVQIRFTLGPTTGNNNASGWHVDNLMITGNFITRDVGVTGFLYPEDACGLTDSEHIAVKVENFAIEPTPQNIPIGFSLDGGESWSMDVIAESIGVGESVTHVFTPTADFSQPGYYDILVKTFLDNDQVVTNDTLTATVFSIPTYSRPYTTDFNQSGEFWTPGGPSAAWEWGTPEGEVLQSAHSGEHAWVVNPEGIYENYAASWLESPCFHLHGNDYTVLEFMLQTHTPATDGMAVQFSLNQGATWQLLDMYQDSLTWGWYNATDIQSLATTFGSGKGWSGDSEGFQRARLVLPPLLSNFENVKFRLVFASGENETYEGVTFDSFTLYQAPPDVGVVAFTDPVNDCILSESQSITVEVKNYGINVLPEGTVIPVVLEVDEHPSVFESLTLEQPLSPDERQSFTFEQVYDMTAPGHYALSSYTSLPGDTGFYHPGQCNDGHEEVIEVFGFPEPCLGDDIYTTAPDTLLLQTPLEYVAYLWQDGYTEAIYEVSDLLSQTYSVLVTDENNCQASASVDVFTFDLEVNELLAPESDCELSANEQVVVKLKNQGHDKIVAGSEFSLQLWMDGELVTTETHLFESDLEPQQTVIHAFEPLLYMSEVRTYNFSITHNLTDGVEENNTLNQEVTVYGYPGINLGPDVFTLMADTLVFDAGEEFATYLWQDGSEDRYFSPETSETTMYSVDITDMYGCPARDSVFVFAHDLAISGFLTPVDTCLFESEQPVEILIENAGPGLLAAGTELSVSLLLNGDLVAEDPIVITENMMPGEDLRHTFSHMPDMHQAGLYHLTAFHNLPDGNSENDQLPYDVEAIGYPQIVMPSEVITVNPTMVVVDAGAGFETYLWSNGSEDQFLYPQEFGDYTVWVTNILGCESSEMVSIIPQFIDLALYDLVAPQVICADTEDVAVSVEIKNLSNITLEEGTALELGYHFNNAEEFAEDVVLVADVLPNQTFVHTFSLPLESIGKEAWSMELWLNFDQDEVADNDMLWVEREVYDLPVPFEVTEIFSLQADTLVLDAGGGYVSYLWGDASTEQLFHINNLTSQSYTVTVEDHNGCFGTGTVDVWGHDLSVKDLLAPFSSCVLGEEEVVSVELKNTGHDVFYAGETIELSLKHNQQLLTTETLELSYDLLPGQSMVFDFAYAVDFSEIKVHDIIVFHHLTDAFDGNDTLETTVEVYGNPEIPLPHMIPTTQADTLVLDAGEGHASYLWQDGYDGRFYSPPFLHTYTYSVTVTDSNNCTSYHEVEVFAADLAITDLLSPGNHCELPDEHGDIKIRLKNTGQDIFEAQTPIPLTMSLDQDTVEEIYTLQQDLHPGESVVHTFATTFFTEQFASFEFKFWHGLDDAIPGNDTLATTVYVTEELYVSLGDDIYTLQPDTLLIDAGDFVSYVWQDGYEGRFYSPTLMHSATYSVWVTDVYGCQGGASVTVHAFDYAIDQIMTPLSHCTLSTQEHIGFSLMNTGLDTINQGTVIPLAIQAQDDLVVEEEFTFSTDLLPGDAVQITSESAFDFSQPGLYTLSVSFTGTDADSSNNTLYKELHVSGLPEVDLGDDIFTTRADTLWLDPGEGFATYLWDNGHTEQFFTPTQMSSATYSVWVTDIYGCEAYGEISIFAHDLALVELESPMIYCGIPEASGDMAVRFANTGHDILEAGLEIPLMLWIDGEPYAEELVLEHNLNPGDEGTYTFQQKLEMPHYGEYYLEMYLQWVDAQPANDTLELEVQVVTQPMVNLGDDLFTLSADTLVFDAGEGFDSYLWQDGSSTQTFSPSWLHSDTYSVVVTDQNSCTATDSVQVWAFDLAIASLDSPQIPVCGLPEAPVAISVQLTNTGHDTFEAGLQLPVFMNSDGVISEEIHTLEEDVLPGDSFVHVFEETFFADTYGVSVLEFTHGLQDAHLSNNTLEVEIGVYPSIEVDLGTDIYTLSPDTLVLDAGEGFASYTWQDGAAGQFYTPAVMQSAQFSVVVESYDGCTASDSIWVFAFDFQVEQLLAPASNCTLSSAENLMFSVVNNSLDTIAPGTSMPFVLQVNDDQWAQENFMPEHSILPGESVIFTSTTAFDFSQIQNYDLYIEYTGQDADPENDLLFSEVVVTGVPMVILGEDIITSRPDTVMLDAGAGFETYLWQDGVTTTRFYDVQVHGVYHVVVSDQWGCMASDTITVELGTTAGNQLAEYSLKVFPNPADDYLHLQYDRPTEPHLLEITWIDVSGNRVYNQKHQITGQSVVSMYVGHLSAGVYLLKIFDGTHSQVVRFIKK